MYSFLKFGNIILGNIKVRLCDYVRELSFLRVLCIHHMGFIRIHSGVLPSSKGVN